MLIKEVKSYAEPGLDNVKIQSSKLHRVRIISQREFNPEVLQAKYCSKPVRRGPPTDPNFGLSNYQGATDGGSKTKTDVGGIFH